MPVAHRRKHRFGAIVDQIKPYAGNFLYHLGEGAKAIGIPAPLVEFGVNAGLGYIADYQPDIANPTFGSAPVVYPKAPSDKVMAKQRIAHRYQAHEAEKQIAKDFGIIDYPPLRRYVPEEKSLSPFGPYSGSDLRYRNPTAARDVSIQSPSHGHLYGLSRQPISPVRPNEPLQQVTAEVYEFAEEEPKAIKNRAAALKRAATKKRKEEEARLAIAAAETYKIDKKAFKEKQKAHKAGKKLAKKHAKQEKKEAKHKIALVI